MRRILFIPLILFAASLQIEASFFPLRSWTVPSSGQQLVISDDLRKGISEKRVLYLYPAQCRCRVLHRVVLPPGPMVSDYHIAAVHDAARTFAVIASAKVFYVYNLRRRQLSARQMPSFPEAEAMDAQSGNLSNLRISDDGTTLFGNSYDIGPFSYSLNDLDKPRQQ